MYLYGQGFRRYIPLRDRYVHVSRLRVFALNIVQRRSRIIIQQDDSSSDGFSYYSAFRAKPKKTAKPWSKFVHKLKEHDNNMVKGWKEDIDTLLVYVSLSVHYLVVSML